MIIDRAKFTEFEPHKFSAFASDLGFPPGYWPDAVRVNVGNGRLSIRTFSRQMLDGSLDYVRYDQQLSCVSVLIYND